MQKHDFIMLIKNVTQLLWVMWQLILQIDLVASSNVVWLQVTSLVFLEWLLLFCLDNHTLRRNSPDHIGSSGVFYYQDGNFVNGVLC